MLHTGLIGGGSSFNAQAQPPLIFGRGSSTGGQHSPGDSNVQPCMRAGVLEQSVCPQRHCHFVLDHFMLREGCAGHCRMFSNIHGFNPLDARNSPTGFDKGKMSSDVAKCP